MLKNCIILLVILGFSDFTAAGANNGPCVTPKNEQSSCIQLKECPALFNIIKRGNLTTNEVEYLSKSQCGYSNKEVLVCCPPEVPEPVAEIRGQFGTNYGPCVTPKNEASTCIELMECQTLLNIIHNPNLSTEERTFLSQSQCGYKNKKVLVCCPPQVPERVDESRFSICNSLLPQYPKCGISLGNRIYGGNVTAIDEYPWMALLEYMKPGNRKGFHCGGTLINNRYVITAAHCLLAVPSDWRLIGVRLGEWDLNSNPDCSVDTRGHKDCAPEHIDVGVEERIAHPQYNPRSRSQENDIALIRLSRTITMSDFVKPICLPCNNNLRTANFLNDAMDVAGWGRTETSESSPIKLKATVTGWDFQRCKNKYTSQRITLQSTQMCAGGVVNVDSCRGDSGGPLVIEEKINNNPMFFLVGIVSFGPTPCGLEGWPGVYTRVGDYIDWIENTIRA